VEKVSPYVLETTLENTVDRASTKSYVAVLSEDARAEVRKNVAGIVEKGEDKVWIDEEQGTFEYPYNSYIVIAHKK
jgi:hypothetical protein